MSAPPVVDAASVDISDPALWEGPEEAREAAFAALRRDRPVAFFAEPPLPEVEPGPGFWAITRYDDVMRASRHPEVFRSGQGVQIPDIPMQFAEVFSSMLVMDAPRHTKLRNLVNRRFTPKRVAELNASITVKAKEIVDAVAAKGECELVAEVAARLPMWVTCDLLGVPEEEHQRVFDLTAIIGGRGDPEFAMTVDDLLNAAIELHGVATELGEDRLSNPRDDISSDLVHADVDGEHLTTSEYASFFIMLVMAGNETTRNGISHGIKLLTDHPDQRRILLEDFDGVIDSAIEEIVRYASPVIHFRRTAATDVEVGGAQIAAGDKVVLWYNSANRDESHWDDPFTFDVRRSPNDHVGFGAGGPHFCLGANLARREMHVMFAELLHRLSDIEVTGEPEMLRSNFYHGIKRMPCGFTPR